jgi:hypothetical protein
MPKDPADTFTQAGDIVIGHTAGQASQYRDAAAGVRQRQQSNLPPAGSVQVTTAVPASVPLPDLGASRQIIGHEITRLAMSAEALQRQAEAPPIGLGNACAAASPYLADLRTAAAASQAQARVDLDRTRAEMAELESTLADPGRVQQWAGAYVQTHPGALRGR